MASLFQLTANSLSAAPKSKIIKAEEMQSLLSANELLETAKKRAGEILENAEKA